MKDFCYHNLSAQETKVARHLHWLSKRLIFLLDLPIHSVPVRKYSKAWRKHWWNKAVVAGIIPRVIYAAVAVVCVSLWVGLTYVYCTWVRAQKVTAMCRVYFAREDTKWQETQITRFGERSTFGFVCYLLLYVVALFTIILDSSRRSHKSFRPHWPKYRQA
jgi:hypothetical protein